MRTCIRHRRGEAGRMKKSNGVGPVVRNVIRDSKLLTLGLTVTIAGAVVSALIPPLILESVIDSLSVGAAVTFRLAFFYFAAVAAAGLLEAAKESLITVFGQKVTRGLRHRMCENLSRLSADYFTRTEPGITASRFVNDVDTVEDLFTSGIISMFADACEVIGILVVIFVKSLGLGVLMAVVTPLLFLFTRYIQKQMLSAQLANRIAVGKGNNHIPETIRNIRMIHVFHREGYMERKYDGYIQEGYRAVEKSNFYNAVYSPVVLIVEASVIAAMMILSAAGGGMRRFFGMTVGTAVAVIAYVGRVFSPLEDIGMEIQDIQSAVAGVRRIGEFLNEPERGRASPAIRSRQLLTGGAPCVEFRDVTFGYEPAHPVLKNRNFTIMAGENVTFTGRTGAGKSTIFKLILGLYSPQSGSVSVYGARADQIPDGEKRKLFGCVEQSFRMVPGTVADQITLFDPEVSRMDAEKAACTVGLHDDIQKLEHGYDTPCTLSLFSQGQWQLLSIARAIAANPAILLLDEITANLDSDTEQRVLAALRRASENRTVISISHRLYKQTGGREIRIGSSASNPADS